MSLRLYNTVYGNVNDSKDEKIISENSQEVDGEQKADIAFEVTNYHNTRSTFVPFSFKKQFPNQIPNDTYKIIYQDDTYDIIKASTASNAIEIAKIKHKETLIQQENQNSQEQDVVISKEKIIRKIICTGTKQRVLNM